MRYRLPILVGITLLSAVGVVWSQDDTIQDDNGDGFLDFAEGDTIYAKDINANFAYTADHINRFEGAVTITSEGSVVVPGSISASGFSGDGSSLTNLTADNLTTGRVGTARLGAALLTRPHFCVATEPGSLRPRLALAGVGLRTMFPSLPAEPP